jgi:hypothetical protein
MTMIESKYDNDLVVLHEDAIVTERLDPGLIKMRTLSKHNDCMLSIHYSQYSDAFVD